MSRVRRLIPDALPIKEEINLVIQAMYIFGKRYSIASYQAMRLEAYMKASVEDYQLLDHMAESTEFGLTPKGP